MKFCKQTLIFPNFISTVTLKQYEKGLAVKSLMTYSEFELILKDISLIAFKSNLSKQDKVSAFLWHLNINCQSTYHVSSLSVDLPLSKLYHSDDNFSSPIKNIDTNIKEALAVLQSPTNYVKKG